LLKRPQSLSLDRQQTEMSRAADGRPQYETRTIVLGVITGSTVLDASNYRWTYSWEEAILDNNSVIGAQSKSAYQSTAISISELSNRASHNYYAYGVDKNQLFGFLPVAIPIGTYVLLTPLRRLDGGLRWVIINTQALDGACPE